MVTSLSCGPSSKEFVVVMLGFVVLFFFFEGEDYRVFRYWHIQIVIPSDSSSSLMDYIIQTESYRPPT